MYLPRIHDCVDQAIGLQNYLVKAFGDQKGSIPFWYIGTEQRTTGGWGYFRLYHNVVVLTPKPGNPMPLMILDTFHGPYPGRTQRGCICDTYANFKSNYPHDAKGN